LSFPKFELQGYRLFPHTPDKCSVIVCVKGLL
jgi:hypothetical protein